MWNWTRWNPKIPKNEALFWKKCKVLKHYNVYGIERWLFLKMCGLWRSPNSICYEILFFINFNFMKNQFEIFFFLNTLVFTGYKSNNFSSSFKIIIEIVIRKTRLRPRLLQQSWSQFCTSSLGLAVIFYFYLLYNEMTHLTVIDSKMYLFLRKIQHCI